MRGRSSGKTAPPATRASPGKAGGLKTFMYLADTYVFGLSLVVPSTCPVRAQYVPSTCT